MNSINSHTQKLSLRNDERIIDNTCNKITNSFKKFSIFFLISGNMIALAYGSTCGLVCIDLLFDQKCSHCCDLKKTNELLSLAETLTFDFLVECSSQIKIKNL